jgi:hypothetical protein
MPIAVTAIQTQAKEAAVRFLELASSEEDAKVAASWSLAAKNAISVAVSCETILKIQNGGR